METTTLILTTDDAAKMPSIIALDPAGPLRDAVRRALRKSEHCWVLMALHLSRLPAPAPRPHHRRIAKAVLNDAASRREGQLFTLPNGDYVLLFPAPDGGASLLATLAELFAPDAPDPRVVLSRWLLPAEFEQLSAFLDSVPAVAAGPHGVDPDVGLSTVSHLYDGLEPGRIRDLLVRQTGVLVAVSGATRVVPLFREVRFSLPALEARAIAPGHLTADPFLFRHLVAKLGPIVLDAVLDELRGQGPMLAWPHLGRLALHLDMSVEAILSPVLDRLRALAQSTGARIAVEIALVEAYADADAFALARQRLREADFALVLDDVSQHALAVTRPAALHADLLKLDWSHQMPLAGPVFERALQAFGPGKVILHKADTEEAMRWGIAHGIRRFQGRHVDTILAASRIAACPQADRCSLRQCADREAAPTALGRAGCANLPLLDAASPVLSHFE